MPPKSKLRALAGSALRAQPDRRLVRLAREGHQAAMEEIVRRYRPALVGFAARIVPSHRAEDVVQESLSRAMIALGEADDRELKLKPWLYAIVRNRALNDLRDERTHEPIPDDFDGVPQPQDVAQRREELAALVTAMGELPDGQRDAIVQRELEGRSHEEIATRIGSTPGAVRGLIFRARLTLRDAAGAVVPLPLVRWLLNEASGAEAAAGAGGAAAAGGLAAAGAAGGGGVAMKSGVALVVATLAVGSGAALRDDGKRSAAQASDRSSAQQERSGSSSVLADRSGSGSGSGSNSGPSSNSGPGGGDDDGEDNSGPGGGGGGDNSGPGGGDDNGDNSGTGGGGDDDKRETERVDNSGTGGGGGSGSGSGSGGSGSSGSGSGSGGSGSGGSGSGNSGSGSSGSGGGDDEPDEPDDD